MRCGCVFRQWRFDCWQHCSWNSLRTSKFAMSSNQIKVLLKCLHNVDGLIFILSFYNEIELCLNLRSVLIQRTKYWYGYMLRLSVLLKGPSNWENCRKSIVDQWIWDHLGKQHLTEPDHHHQDDYLSFWVHYRTQICSKIEWNLQENEIQKIYSLNEYCDISSLINDATSTNRYKSKVRSIN